MSKAERREVKAEVIEQVAEMAMKLSRPYLGDYGALRSRHDFTQRQLLSCLVLKAYLKRTYRGVIEVLQVSERLRGCLGLEKKLPHFRALQKFSGRSQVVAIVQTIIGQVAGLALQQTPRPAVAMDSTGLATTTASAYFQSRRGKRCRQRVKVSTVVICGSLLPMALVLDWGPSNDRVQVPALLQRAQAVGPVGQLYADAGYDAEWIHEQCREQWGAESLIKPNGQRADGTRNGRWRAGMSTAHLQERGYGLRWAVESFFSGLKRTMGAALSSRRPDQMLAEAAFRVLAYTLRR